MFSWLPDGLRGKILVKSYLNQLKKNKLNINKIRKDLRSGNFNAFGDMPEFTRKILHQPGNVTAMYRYLADEGKNLIPEITEHHLGDHWYTGLVKKLSGTSIGNGIFLNKFLDKTLPTINGDNSLAKRFLEAGGHV